MEYRKRILVKGRVQGVGFRYFTIRLAESYPVCGYVRNLPEGAVEIVAEGAVAAVEDFLARAAQGPSYALVTEVKTFVEPPVGTYKSFDIHH